MGWHFRRYLEYEETKTRKMISEKELIKFLLKFITPYKYSIIFLILLSLINLATGLVTPYLTKILIDEYIVNKNYTGFIFILAIFILIAVINFLSSSLNTYYLAKVGQGILYSMRSKMYGHLLRLRLEYFKKNETGAIISRIINDVDAVSDIITSGAISTFINVLSISGSIIIMYEMNVELTLISLTIIPLIVLTSYIFSRWTRRAYKKTREKIAKVTTSIEQTVSGAKVSQAFVRRKKIDIQKFEETNREYLRASMEANKLFSSISPIMNLIRAGGIALLLWYGGMMILNNRLTIGTLIAFYAYTERFFGPVISLTMFYNTIQSALAASERIYEFLHEDIERDRPNAIELDKVKGKIEYRHVYFSYDSETPLFKDFNLNINPGETIAIVGPTGAGKTSLIKLLFRFHEINGGVILLDNIDTRNIKLSSLRSHIGLVLQEDYLFKGTVLENIRIGNPSASIDEVKRVVKELGIEEFIESLPNGYNTSVLEGGKNLSAGQRQLIAFARALLSNPKILVLDEATSSVDPYTEKLIQNALEKMIKDKTCIIIAHRLSTVRLADRIVVLSDGRVVEEGTHEELLKKKGLYAKLYYEQLGKSMIEAVSG